MSPSPKLLAISTISALSLLGSATIAQAQYQNYSRHDLVYLLQQELYRVGCYTGKIDGVWGPKSDYALHAYAHFGKVQHADWEPSGWWIDSVKGYQQVVCPPNYVYSYTPPSYQQPTTYQKPVYQKPTYQKPTYQKPTYGGGGGGGY